MASALELQDRSSLRDFVNLVRKWNRSINLVSVRSPDELWSRHVADSWHLADGVAADAALWLDVGSGGGFPAVVVALRLAEEGRRTRVVAVEADQRKAAFIREAARVLDLGATLDVIACRVENLEPLGADILSARAVAPLKLLFGLVLRQFGANTLGLFPKGRRVQEEIEEAREVWTFHANLRQTPAEDGGIVVEVRGLSRAA